MVKIESVYQGGLHCELIHGPSGSRFETDAPVDNQGKGERFSPTDLMGAALGSCILTTMGIVAAREGIHLEGARVEVLKEMITTSPRRVGKLLTTVTMPKGVPSEQRARLEGAAHRCPVHQSLHPEIEAPITFHYPD